MRNFTILMAFLSLIACKQEVDNKQEIAAEAEKEVVEKEVKKETRFPEGIDAIFNAHGSYDAWRGMNTLQYTLLKEGNPETHLTDLKTRKTLLTSDKFTIGFDGNDVWVNKDGEFPANRARFYHNLYFYFYAMPFILGDPGITYEAVEALSFEGKDYPGFKISYGENVGDSPDDNYFIYYDKDTNKMAWLGYTVTYGSDGPSDKISYIQYSDWTNVNGLDLPKSLQWFASEDGVPTKPAGNKTEFDNIIVKKEKEDAAKFAKPEDALIGEK